LGDDEFSVGIRGEPHPAGTEQGSALLLELLLEGFERPEVLGDRIGDISRRLVVRLSRTELSEVEFMVQYLSCVVEDSASRFFDDLHERRLFEARAGQQRIEVVYVSLQVLSMVEGDGLLADNWFQRIGGVGECHQFKFLASHICLFLSE